MPARDRHVDRNPSDPIQGSDNLKEVRHKMKRTSAFSMTLGVACILAAPHVAQSTTANVGTLTCTLTAPESEVGNVGVSIQAACSFTALDGRNARFVGSISRGGSVVQPTAKAVVALSVN